MAVNFIIKNREAVSAVWLVSIDKQRLPILLVAVIATLAVGVDPTTVLGIALVCNAHQPITKDGTRLRIAINSIGTLAPLHIASRWDLVRVLQSKDEGVIIISIFDYKNQQTKQLHTISFPRLSSITAKDPTRRTLDDHQGRTLIIAILMEGRTAVIMFGRTENKLPLALAAQPLLHDLIILSLHDRRIRKEERRVLQALLRDSQSPVAILTLDEVQIIQ